MEKLNKKTPVFLYVAIIVFILLVISTRLTGGLFARYTTSETASDKASVAGFNISTVTDGNSELELDLSNAVDKINGSYKFSVKNNSEVKVSCTVTITLDKKLPNGVEIMMNLGESNIELEKVSDTQYTYTNTMDFQENNEYTLIFTGDPATVTDITEINVSIGVAIEQID